MKLISRIALTAAVVVSAFGTITYTSCNKDECKDVVCSNGGTCNSDNGSCTCATGWEGTTCTERTRDKFLGTWSGADVCGTDTYTITLVISNSSNDIQALINNPGGFGNNITITGSVSGTNQLTFTDANVGGGRTLTGTMTLTTSNALKFDYTVDALVGDDVSCTGNYSKQ